MLNAGNMDRQKDLSHSDKSQIAIDGWAIVRFPWYAVVSTYNIQEVMHGTTTEGGFGPWKSFDKP